MQNIFLESFHSELQNTHIQQAQEDRLIIKKQETHLMLQILKQAAIMLVWDNIRNLCNSQMGNVVQSRQFNMKNHSYQQEP